MTEIILVTGAAGFIGSHLCEALAGTGYKVKALDIIPPRDPAYCLKFAPDRVLKNIQPIVGDVRNGHCVKSEAKNASCIFHLAAEVSIPYSYKFPGETVCANVIGTLNVLTAARDTGVRKVIHVSSSEVYGTAKQKRMDEFHPLRGQSPYSASKIGADKLAESFHLAYGLPVVIVRPFNSFGPRQSARAVIPCIIRQLMAGRKLALGNTSPERDFTFVSDTVRALIRAMGTDEAVGREINIGSGKCISVAELAAEIGRLMGVKPEISREKSRVRPKSSEVDRLCADSRLAKELLGWKPRVKMEDGLREVIKWSHAHPDFSGNDRG